MESNADADAGYQDADGTANHAAEDSAQSPRPPPHMTPPLPQPPPLSPEAHKVMGNKYYIVKDFKGAVAEYSKGIIFSPFRFT